MEKSVVVTTIVDTVRKASPEGSFIRKVKGQWQEVSEGVARERVGQKLRDIIDANYKSSTHSKRRRRVFVAFEQPGKGIDNDNSSSTASTGGEDAKKPSAEVEGLSGKSNEQVEPSRLGFLDVAREARGILEPPGLEMPALNMPATLDIPGQAGVSDTLANQLQQEAFGLDNFPEAQGDFSERGNDCLNNAVRMFEQHPLIPQRTGTDMDHSGRFLSDNSGRFLGAQPFPSMMGNLGVGQVDQGHSAGQMIQDPFLVNNFPTARAQNNNLLPMTGHMGAEQGRSVGPMQDPFLSRIDNFPAPNVDVNNHLGFFNQNSNLRNTSIGLLGLSGDIPGMDAQTENADEGTDELDDFFKNFEQV